MKSKSSCSDNEEYPEFCLRAATDNEVFKAFRRSPEYTSIVETVPYKNGKEYLKIAFEQTPGIKRYVDKFASSELIGNPEVFPYRTSWLSPKISFSPTTLRYIKVLSDLMFLFGNLNDTRIVEIGGGYGGQCKIICDVFDIQEYVLVDLSPCLKLSQRYLSSLQVENVIYKTSEDLASGFKSDLVISNYAFSEIRRDIQDFYLDQILKTSPRGYMHCNFKTHTWDAQQYSESELLAKLDGVEIIKSKSRLSSLDESCEISLLVWGHNPDRKKSKEVLF